MFDYSENTLKKRFFINIQIAKKNINLSTVKRQKILDYMIFDQNIVKEAGYKYRQAFQNVYVSTKVLQSIFPQAPCLALIDATRFASYTKPEISLLEALEFIAFDWWPTDEYGEKFQSRERYYQTDPCSEEGQKQIKALSKAVDQIEALIAKGLPFRPDTATMYNEHVGFTPKVSITDNDTMAVLTDVNTQKSYANIFIKYEDLKVAYEEAARPHPNAYTLKLDNHKLYIVRNGMEYDIHTFKQQYRGKQVPKTEIVLKYILNHPNQEISWQELNDNVPDLCTKDGTNFNNLLQCVFSNNIKKAIKRYFFKSFSAQLIRYESVIYDFPDWLLI